MQRSTISSSQVSCTWYASEKTHTSPVSSSSTTLIDLFKKWPSTELLFLKTRLIKHSAPIRPSTFKAKALAAARTFLCTCRRVRGGRG